jgi:hypothetical protein
MGVMASMKVKERTLPLILFATRTLRVAFKQLANTMLMHAR